MPLRLVCAGCASSSLTRRDALDTKVRRTWHAVASRTRRAGVASRASIGGVLACFSALRRLRHGLRCLEGAGRCAATGSGLYVCTRPPNRVVILSYVRLRSCCSSSWSTMPSPRLTPALGRPAPALDRCNETAAAPLRRTCDKRRRLQSDPRVRASAEALSRCLSQQAGPAPEKQIRLWRPSPATQGLLHCA